MNPPTFAPPLYMQVPLSCCKSVNKTEYVNRASYPIDDPAALIDLTKKTWRCVVNPGPGDELTSNDTLIATATSQTNITDYIHQEVSYC